MNEHKMCCGTVADKVKLCAEIEQRDRVIAAQQRRIDALEAALEASDASLAALKAQWQAEAIEQSVKLCRRKVFDGPDLYSDAVLHYASELLQSAQDTGYENS